MIWKELAISLPGTLGGSIAWKLNRGRGNHLLSGDFQILRKFPGEYI
jgi:hypothetical protein